MDKETVDKINRSSMKLSMVVTGGGSQFIGDFLSFSGGSNTILDFQVPYSQEAHENYIGMKIGYKYVSEEAAFQLAKAAYKKMVSNENDKHLLGVGVTASLTKDNEREGRANHFYVGIADMEYVYVYHIEIDTQELNWREGQEKFVSEMILTLLNDRESFPYKKFFKYPFNYHDNVSQIDLKQPVCFFSGSFNPWHEGHQAIYNDLVSRYKNVVLELSQYNRDKPAVPSSRLSDRVKDLGIPYIITHHAFIVDKIKYLKHIGFEDINIAMGLDTWVRFIADGFNTDHVAGVSFIVYNRGNDEFKDYGMDVKFIDGFDFNISSTQIREKLALTKGQNNA